MWLIKGFMLGGLMFFVFSLLYFWAWGFFGNKAIGLVAIRSLVTHNPLYWIACAPMIVLGCLIVFMWPARV